MSKGRATCAPARFNCAISIRIASGQFADSEASGAIMELGAGTAGGAVFVAAGKTVCAGIATAGAGGTTRAGGVTTGARGTTAGLGAEVDGAADGAKRLFAGATRLAGSGAAAGAACLGRTENGFVISADTLATFCAEERTSNFGSNRASTSFSGSATGSASNSVPTRNRSGTALRNCPKVILTAPVASCGKIWSVGMWMRACASSAAGRVIFARKSAGNFSRIGWRGSSNSPLPAGREGSGATGGRGSAGIGTLVSFFSTCRSHPNSIPANLDFTVLDIAFIALARVFNARPRFQQEARQWK